MEFPDERLEVVLGEYMAEFDFGRNLPVCDTLVMAESFVNELFALAPGILENASRDVLSDSTIPSLSWGKELLKRLKESKS